ncbi:hypothetical protein [Staphylococcus borealis]|uniref:hypothetical protein n=1 Tax=Staphylococcus borealis TaxID=2742203 RepID=UPI0039E9F247
MDNKETPQENLKKLQVYNELKQANNEIFNEIIDNSSLLEAMKLQTLEVENLSNDISKIKNIDFILTKNSKSIRAINENLETIKRNFEEEINKVYESSKKNNVDIIEKIELQDSIIQNNLKSSMQEISKGHSKTQEIIDIRLDGIEKEFVKVNEESILQNENNKKTYENLNQNVLKDFSQKHEDITSLFNTEFTNIKKENKNDKNEIELKLKKSEETYENKLNQIKEELLNKANQNEEKSKKGIIINTIIGTANFILLIILMILNFV